MDAPYTLSYCVDSVLADLGETNKRHYQKYMHYAIQGFRRLNLGNMVDTTIRTVQLEIDENTNTAQLPPDYVDFLKVGYSCRGTIINLDYSDSLRFELSNELFPDACECQDQLNQCQQYAISPNSGFAFPFVSSIWYYNSFWRNGQYVGGIYGQGAGVYRNAYRIDKNKWQIQFDSYITADFVILEYISNGIDCGDAVIEETLIPAITAYVHWKAALHDPNRNRLEARMYEDIWKREARGVMARRSALSAWDWRNTYRKTLIATPKR